MSSPAVAARADDAGSFWTSKLVTMDRRAFVAAASLGLIGAACNGGRSKDAAPTSTNQPPESTATSGSSAAPTTLDLTTAPGSTASDGIDATTPSPTTSEVLADAPWSAADFAGLDQFMADTAGDAMMIVEGGTVVHEWYKAGDPSYVRDIASAQKSVVSVLVGIAVDRGLVTLESTIDSLIGPGWASGDTPTVTVEHLLTMTSGVNNRYRVISPPGEAWRYTAAFATLFTVIERVSGRGLNDVASEWLFDPAGATGAEFRDRPVPGVLAETGLVCTAAQLAAIGQMVLAPDPQPVSRTWLDESFASSQTYNPAYGRLWWLNGKTSFIMPEGGAFDGPLIPSAPSDVVAALGKDDQKLYICPSLDLVVVRLGNNARADSTLALSDFDNELWRRLTTERTRTA
jgi:CubicO group peptidase (beta-lactamase class C family)